MISASYRGFRNRKEEIKIVNALADYARINKMYNNHGEYRDYVCGVINKDYIDKYKIKLNDILDGYLNSKIEENAGIKDYRKPESQMKNYHLQKVLEII